jgi:hypothetical protein
MIQVKIGTTSWKSCPDGVADPGYVTYDGEFIYDETGKRALMVWDTNNVRPMTQAEIDALPAQRKAVRDAAEPDLATIRDLADAAITDITAYLQIADSATNAQVRAEVKAIDQRQRAIIRAIKRLAQRVVG